MNTMVHAKFGLGASVLRVEDNALITGNGRYTDDHNPSGTLHAYVVRSPHAHARLTVNDVEAAREADGVHLVLTAADITHLNALPCRAMPSPADGSKAERRDIPVLCADVARYVGDAVAVVVADSVQLARDAAELVDVDYEPMEAATDTEAALEDGAALVYPEAGSNLAYREFDGDEEKTKAAFSKAAKVSEIKIINNRLVCNYMEPRSCLAEWKDDEDRFEVIVGSQGVHGMQRDIAHVMGIETDKLHLITPDVGGGFGTKGFNYREYPLTLEAAKRLGRPVKWTSDRTEHFLTDAHGRDNVTTARMAMDENGRFLAIEVDTLAAMGAYYHCFGPFIPKLSVTMTTGLYDIEAMAVTVRGVFSHTTPTDAYRGAGRPEAAYMLERLVDRCAMDMGLSAAEIRERNFIKPEQLPYTTVTNRTYDTGEFAEHMKACMERAKWNGFDERNDEAKARGRIRGIGMSTYVEICAFAGSEPAYVELKSDGTVDLKIGTQSNGQGHATAYAQIAAEKLGLDTEQVKVRQGDTDELSAGGGTGGSRSVPLGGVSAQMAGEALAEKIRAIAADRMEASPGDVELAEGAARIVGTDRVMTFADVAQAASDPEDLKAEGEFKQAEATYPNGTHICEVEVDPATGVTEVVGYTIVDDFGVTVNPLLLAGQMHGGVVQSIGQCLNERVVYDEDGQLLTATFMDYSMPRAAELPNFDFQTRNVPSTTNALGIKGAGEAGTIAATPAVMNAIVDALRRGYGIEHIDMPVTPAAMWAAIEGAKGG